MGGSYSAVGEHIGDAFKCGVEINPKAKLDTLEEIRSLSKKA